MERLEKRIEWHVLDRRVIVVAVEGQVKDWAAYVGAVPGENLDKEWLNVRDHGTKLRREVAKLLFPNFRDLRYRD